MLGTEPNVMIFYPSILLASRREMIQKKIENLVMIFPEVALSKLLQQPQRLSVSIHGVIGFH